MERRVLGRTGMEISVLGFGGAEIGFEKASLSDVKRMLHSAFDAGLNMIDTAECYDNSEELIGEATAGRRDDYFLFTKCGHAAGIDLPDWDVRLLEQSIDRSLQRLKTDHIDLLQLHSCSEETLRAGDVIDVLQKAQDSGKTRFIGYSGDREAARYAVECGVFDVLQTSINIADQQALELTLPIARANNMGVIAKRPVANMAWTKHYEEGDYRYPYWQRLQELDYPFLKDENAIGTVLRWVLSQEGVTTAIVGTKNPDRWIQNSRLLEAGLLSEEENAAIRERWDAVAKSDWVGQV